jgi:hypothetical protein
MKEERSEKGILPIACTLTPTELAAQRSGLLPGLLTRATAREPVRGGFRWRFEPHDGLLNDVARVIDAEHRCCRFLRFHWIVEPGDGPLWLEVTGPEGTEDFLTALGEGAPVF